jgi:hypothetical protein
MAAGLGYFESWVLGIEYYSIRLNLIIRRLLVKLTNRATGQNQKLQGNSTRFFE